MFTALLYWLLVWAINSAFMIMNISMKKFARDRPELAAADRGHMFTVYVNWGLWVILYLSILGMGAEIYFREIL